MFYVVGKKELICKTIYKQTRELHHVIDRLPRANECFKLISMGNFSSIAFIIYISAAVGIRKLCVSSLTIGKNELRALMTLHNNGLLLDVSLYVGWLMKNSGNEKDYGYFQKMVEVCQAYGWHFRVLKNHSKVILAETADGVKYVIETSSNLTETPSVEQFSFERDAGLYGFYERFLREMEGEDYGRQGAEKGFNP